MLHSQVAPGVSLQQSVMGKGASGFYEIARRQKLPRLHPQRVVRQCRVSDGTTMFRGIVECVTKELTEAAPSTMRSRQRDALKCDVYIRKELSTERGFYCLGSMQSVLPAVRRMLATLCDCSA